MRALWLKKARLLTAYPRAVLDNPRAALRYLVHDREFTNLTYDIDNLDELIEFIAIQLARQRDEIAGFVHEPLSDDKFLQSLRRALRSRADRNDEPRFGRRLGWYAVLRALRPSLVVETGVHDGLGSSLLLRALDLNGSGQLVGFDLDDQSGWLIPAWLRGRYRLIVGDVRVALPAYLADTAVDVFIHDSLHTYEHELFELSTALNHPGDEIVLISDNAHATSALADLSEQSDLSYALFLERPREHFYPGAGLGLALRRAASHT